MRALVITKHGAPEVFEVQERPDPRPGAGEILIEVKAAGINFADVMARAGLYPDAPKPPMVVGYEVAGVIKELGEGATGFAVGDRVMGGTRFGGYAELAVSNTGSVVRLPDDWSFEEGAAFPVNYATAYAGVGLYGNLRPGEKLLIQAAAGGVGIASTQLAKLAGAEIFGTASASKHDAIRGFGVDHAIDYRNDDFVAEVRRIAGRKEPIDLIMDAIAGESFKQGYSLLRPGGRIVCFGASSVVSGERRSIPAAIKMFVQTPRFNTIKMMSESKTVIGLNMLTIWDDRGTLDDFIKPLEDLIAAGSVRPVVAEAFALDRGADAHRFILERKNVGKVVLTV